MHLPEESEYNIAIQNPNTCFSDNDLRGGDIQTNNLGLPTPYSGGFTTTYKITTGNLSWAVRCFIRDVHNLQIRYQAIDDFIDRNRVDYLVEARYFKYGIRAKNDWYPIIKMKWVEGDLLNVYLEKILNKGKEVIESFLQKFNDLVEKLEKDKVSHGDLQHGNIILKNDRVFLIDYDGMYLPEISTIGTGEDGHPNYQHPGRTSKSFNDKMDRFSSIVIYLSIKALSIKPELWKKYNNGENIILRGSDFADPKKSELFYELSQIAELEKLAYRFASVCLSEYDKVPSLKGFLTGNFKQEKVEFAKPQKTRTESSAIISGSQDVNVFNKLYGGALLPNITTSHYKATSETLNTQPTTIPNTPITSTGRNINKKLIAQLVIGGLIFFGIVIWASSSNNNQPVATSTPVVPTWSPIPTDTGIICAYNECSFNGKCLAAPANSSCVTDDPNNAWKCDSGYYEVKENGGGTACYSRTQLNNGCNLSYTGSQWNGVDPHGGTNTCSCPTGYVFNDSNTACIIYSTPIPTPWPTTTPVQSASQLCQNKYGWNTYSDGTYCQCNSGYVWNTGQTACITPSASCNNSYPNTYWDGTYSTTGKYNCACNAGYSWNASDTACY